MYRLAVAAIVKNTITTNMPAVYKICLLSNTTTAYYLPTLLVDLLSSQFYFFNATGCLTSIIVAVFASNFTTASFVMLS